MCDKEGTDALESTFSLVANDIRLDILRTLWDIYTDDPTPDPEPVQFSTLKERVGIRDSGQFHYHLDQLVPRFVSHDNNGYNLTYAGAKIIGAGVSGVYTDIDATLDTQKTEECSQCGGTLRVSYERGRVVIDCDNCDVSQVMSAPPILVAAHDGAENSELLGKFTLTQLQQTVRGFCHLCSGPIEGSVAASSLGSETDANGGVKIVYECTECGAPVYTPATTAVLDHPAVVSLLHEAGTDYREIPSWEIRQTLDSEEQVCNEDPVRVEVTINGGDDDLTFVLDENLQVIE
jgi:RNase P subunit RPR2